MKITSAKIEPLSFGKLVMPEPRALTLPYSRHFLEWLHRHQASIALTTGPTNRLCFIGIQPDGQLFTPAWEFDCPRGLYATAERFYLSTRHQIWRFENVLAQGELWQDKYEKLYVPRVAHTTGDIHIRDLVSDDTGNTVFTNTEYSCLATLHPKHSFAPIWKPPFISKLVPENRCHLNGIATVDGKPRYVTAISRSDVASGWRRSPRVDGGIVIDIQTSQIVASGLSMPHSPRWYRGKLWLLNSGTGDFGYIEKGEFVAVTFCPGYGRGLAFVGDFAVVGLSKPRDSNFSDWSVGERLKEKEIDPRCSLVIIDLKSGDIFDYLDLDAGTTEVYNVAILPGVRCPMAWGKQPVKQPSFSFFSSPKIDENNSKTARNYFNQGKILKKQGKYEEAASHFQKAIEADPNYVPARHNLGSILQEKGRLEAAMNCYQNALKINPNFHPSISNIGSIYLINGDLKKAEKAFDRALKIKPDYVHSLYHLGLVYKQQAKLKDAIDMFKMAIKYQPNFADAYFQLGQIWEFICQFNLAKIAYTKCQQLNPKLENLLGHISFVKLCLCDWKNYDGFVRTMIDSSRQYIAGKKGNSPLANFHLNIIPFPQSLHLQNARNTAALIDKYVAKKPRLSYSKKGDKLRVGYVSPDLCSHAVGRLISGIFERHNRDEFEVFCYPLLNVKDEVTEAIERGCDELRNLGEMSAENAAKQIHSDGIDILIDLAGYTANSKTQIFAYRPAPIQATFLGYPNTIGADFIPYFLTDKWAVPPELAGDYSEEIIYLPHQFPCSPMEISPRQFDRAEMGLPEAGFVFACFNRHYKITPELFDIWMHILKQVEGSVLWLSSSVEEAHENLCLSARERGVAPSRLIFAEKLPHPEYLARLHLADLALDTFIYNGGSTTVVALYAGLPVLTKPGVTNAARMGASICASAHLETLIAKTPEEYVQKALHFATHRDELEGLRGVLKGRNSPLFDLCGFVRNFEVVLQSLWNR